MTFQVAYHTDVGIRKKTNQDGLLIKTAKTPNGPVALFVLCDGMGGLSDGELASATVIRGMSDWFDSQLPDILISEEQVLNVAPLLEGQIRTLNEKILQYGEVENVKLGTTITAMLVIYSRYYIVQIGDSRAYSINSNLTRLTKDQTLVAREVEYGNITEEQAKVDPRRNILLQCVGATKDLNVVITECELEKDTVFLLCTDGFYHEITREELYSAMLPSGLQNEAQMKDRLIKLVELVKSRNETDNISVIAAKVI